MSIEGRRWAQQVGKRTDLSPRAKLVAALSLAERHNGKTGMCTPGQVTIASDIGASASTAERGIADLRDAGLIEVQPRSKKSGRGRTSDSYVLLPCGGIAPKRWDLSVNVDELVSEDQSVNGAGPISQVDTTNPSTLRDQSVNVGDEPEREPRSEQGREPRSTEVALSSLTQQNGNDRPTQGRPNDRLGWGGRRSRVSGRTCFRKRRPTGAAGANRPPAGLHRRLVPGERHRRGVVSRVEGRGLGRHRGDGERQDAQGAGPGRAHGAPAVGGDGHMSLPPAVRAEVRRILDKEARRLLDQQLKTGNGSAAGARTPVARRPTARGR